MSKKLQDLLGKFIARVVAWFTAPFEAWLKRIIKSAAVCLTTPATIKVASQLYPDDPFLSFLVTAAAVVLVEGALLLGWHKLDDRLSQHTIAQRWLYAGLALTAYLVLLVISILHGEGWAGWAFRATLFALLAYSVYESGILANLRLQRSADRDINRHRKVRKHRERMEIRVAIATIDMEENAEMQRIVPNWTRKPSGIAAIIYRITSSGTETNGKYRETADAPMSIPFDWTPLDRQLVELIGNGQYRNTRQAGNQLEVSHTTIGKRINAMKRAKILHVNGHGVEIVAGAE